MTAEKTENGQAENQELFNTSEYGHFYVPDGVVKFLVHLTAPRPHENILAIGFYAPSLDSIIGSEIQSRAIKAEAVSLEQEEGLDESYDVILCAPTFGVVSPESNEPNEEIWLKWSVDHLSENGRLVIIVPIGLLSNYSQEPIRRFLIEKGGLEAVVELPAGWAQGTAIQASVLYITMNLELERPVRMFRLLESKAVPWTILADEARKTKPELPESIVGKSYVIPASQLDSARLDAKYYDPAYEVLPPSPDFEAVQLSELVDIRSGDRFSGSDLEPEGIPFVQVRNLNMDGTLNLEKVKTIKPDLGVDSRSYSRPNDILISIAGTIGKVALVTHGVHVCIDTSLRRLRIRDQSRVLPEYLALYLRADIARLQMERWFSGSVINVLSTPNLEQLIVYLPDLHQQREFVNVFNNLVRRRQEQLLSAFPDGERMLSMVASPAQAVSAQQLSIASAAPEETDLQETIRVEFPFPIARAFTVFNSSENESPFSQVKKLIGLSEAIVHYLHSVLAVDHLKQIELTSPESRSLLATSITDYSIDRRIKYVFHLLNVVQDDPDIALYIPELVDVEFWVCSEIHNNVRNKFSHTDPSEAWCKKAVVDFRPKVERLLKSLLPLRDYRLAQVTNVTVRDGRPQHHVVTMMGDNSLFTTQVEDLDTLLAADTQHIVLIDQNYNILDLHPFYMIHAWESTGMRNHLCVLKQVVGQPPKQKLKFESAEGAGETEVEMYLKLGKLLPELG